MAQVWEISGRRVTRVFRLAEGRWEDDNGLLVREGAALEMVEGSQNPYRSEEVAARQQRVGTHAYGPVAWFWANSTPLFSATLTPGPDISLSFAVARVTPNRIEAGYLRGDNVVLLPTPQSQRLGYYLLEVASRGPRLTIVTAPITGRGKLALTWEWAGTSYELGSAESR